jgi:DNA-binding NtrC family response regulator
MDTRHVECVVLTAFEPVFAFLQNILALAGIRMHRAESVEQADFLLMATGATVLLSDFAMVDGCWRSAVKLIGEHYPLVGMLVMADRVDAPFLEDAPGLGVCGILWKPIEFHVATRLVRTAHQASLDRRSVMEESTMGAPGLFL